MDAKSSEQKKQLGLVLVQAFAAIMVNLAVSQIVRVRALVMASLLFFPGFWLLREDSIPLFLRSRSWIKREIERINSDPSHPLHLVSWPKLIIQVI